MKRLKDNRGLTLVELIVSITILAIMVLPLLTSFVQAAKTNAKAKNKLHATEAAQNIMEGLENVSLEEVVRQFNYPTDASGFDLFDLGSASTVELDYNGSAYSPLSSFSVPAGGTDPVFTPKSSHKYYFYVSGLGVNNSNKKYNALVTLDAKTDVAGTKNKEYNNKKVADMKSVDTTYDAISANADTANSVITAIQLQYGISGITQNDISRTITVDIAKDTSGATTVTASYKYYVKSQRLTFPEAGSLHEEDYTSVIYDNSSHTDDSLKNVYLFYYPWYTSTYAYPMSTDSIVINNPDMVDCNVHIIKQANVDASYLYSSETAYRCSVFLNEPANNGHNPKAHASISTNLGTNMAVADENQAGYNVANQVTYIYNNANANQGLVVNGIIDVNSMTELEMSDRLFDVSVAVYPSSVDYSAIGTETPIVTFTGGMTD